MRHPKQRLIAIPEAAAVTHRHTRLKNLTQALVKAGCGFDVNRLWCFDSRASKILQLQPLYVRLDQIVNKRLEQSDYLDSDRQLINAIETAQNNYGCRWY